MNKWKFYNFSFDDIRKLSSIELSLILNKDEIALLKVLNINAVDILKNTKINENNSLYNLENKIISIKNKIYLFLKEKNNNLVLIRNNLLNNRNFFDSKLNDFDLAFILLISDISKKIIEFDSPYLKIIQEINPLFNFNYFSIFIFPDNFFNDLKINLTDIRFQKNKILNSQIKNNKTKRKVLDYFETIKIFFKNNEKSFFDDFNFSNIIFNNFNEEYVKIIKKIFIDSYLISVIDNDKYIINFNVNNIFMVNKFNFLSDLFKTNNYYLGILKKVLLGEKKENILKEYKLSYNDLKNLFSFFINLKFDFLESKFFDFFTDKFIDFHSFNKITNLSFLSFQYILKKTKYTAQKAKLNIVNEQEFYNYINNKKIDKFLNLSRNNISIIDLIEENIVNNKTKSIILKRLKGQTLEQIGFEFNITRERVRQIIEKSFKNIEYVKEMEYLDLISKYNISFDVFKELTNLSIESYNFLLIIDKNPLRNKKSELDFIANCYVPDNVKNVVHKNNNVIQVNNEIIKNKRLTILEKIIRDSNSTIKWNIVEKEFYDNYYGIYISEKIDRGFKNRLSDSYNILATTNFKYRYYEIDSIDEQTKKQLLDIIYSLQPGCYSTEYIFVSNATLMDEINIFNKYELHNLLKKLFNLDENLTFTRMPHFLFKYKDKMTFYNDILKQLSPIKINDFVEYMVINFGYDKLSFRANIVNELKSHYSNGVFSLKVDEIEESKLNLIKNIICENDILSMDEMIDIFNKLCIDLIYLNSFNLKKINYNMFSKYCCRNDISIEMLLNKIIEEKGEYNEELFKYTNRYGYDLLYDKLLNYDCILVNKSRILTIESFSKITNINKNDIFYLLDNIEAQMNDYDFFSIENIKRKIKSPLLGGVLEDRELTKLITKDKRFEANYSQDFTLIKFSKNNLSMQEFFKKIIIDKIQIKREDLEEYLLNFWISNNFSYISKKVSDFIYHINNDFTSKDEVYYSNDLKTFYKNKDFYINRVLKNN